MEDKEESFAGAAVEAAPTEAEVVDVPLRKKCGCKKLDCRDKRCSCRKAGHTCSSNCGCGGNCMNSAEQPTTASPTPVPTPPRAGPAAKERLFHRVVPGQSAPAHALHSRLGHLLRDDGITRRLADVVKQHGSGDFYLTRARAASSSAGVGQLDANGKKLQVDHTWEVQLLSHCVAQTPAFFPVLAQVDCNTSSTSLSGQPFAVQNALLPLYNTQNGGRDFACFNLRALTQEINVKKGAIYKSLLVEEAARGGDFRCGDFRVHAKLCRSLEASAACGSDPELAGRVADALLSELRATADIYMDRLQAGLPPGPLTAHTAGAVSKASQAACSLAETVQDLSGRILDD